jgi:hypothetical protein
VTSKHLNTRLNKWLFDWLSKPLAVVCAYLRTNYWLDGRTIIIKRPFSKYVSLSVDDLGEIGIETTDKGPFIEDVFWILKRGDLRIRIGDPHPVFNMLMDRVGSLEGFDWRPFIEAMSCTQNHYFPCWRRAKDPA